MKDTRHKIQIQIVITILLYKIQIQIVTILLHDTVTNNKKGITTNNMKKEKNEMKINNSSIFNLRGYRVCPLNDTQVTYYIWCLNGFILYSGHK